jgi:alginate O-acetyltransferase complex protein AlgJ
MDRSPRVQRTTEIVVIGMFLAAISLPLGGKLLGLESAFALSENRRPEPLPTIELKGWSLVSFPRRFERYWDDSFAFRRHLIRWHSLAKLWLGVSPSPKAILGRDGYLFYAGEQSVDYFRGVKPLTPSGLTRWRRDLENRQRWLAERGIRYLVVIPPNKETIYPEYMPPEIRRVREESRLDQLLAELRTNSKIEVLDLRDALRTAKQERRVYHKTDTHWNDAGALVAYREILVCLHSWFPELNHTPLAGSLRSRLARGGDLAQLMALEDRFPEERIEFQPAEPRQAREMPGDRISRTLATDVVAMECPACGGPRAVMFQDSFNTNLAPLLAEHFSRIVFVDGTRVDPAIIEQERPAIVIQEFVERKLMCLDLREC